MRGRTIVSLILMCIIFAQGCRKDRAFLSETEFHSDQLIQQTDLKKWFETNKNSKLLKLNWAKAQQGVLNGKNVVRIPTIAPENNSSVISTANLKNANLSSKGLSAGIGNTSAISSSNESSNYNPTHPPELFFIQDGPNGKLHSYLLNFVPKDRNKENGDNGVWTGKLLEWNVQGDTVLVQELEQSKVKNYYAIKPGAAAPSNLSNVVKNNKLQSIGAPSIKDKQVSGFFGWLIDKLVEFAGWVGDFFGLSIHNDWAFDRYNMQFNSEYQLNINFDWLTGGGGPPVDPGTTPTPTPVSAPIFVVYIGAGEPVYQSYASGYIGNTTGGGGPGTGTGSGPNTGGPDIYHPYPVWNGESIDGSSSGGPSFTSYNLAAQYLINQGWIVGGDNIGYVNSHKDVAELMVSYMDRIQSPTQDDIDYINWAITAISDPQRELTLDEFSIKYGFKDVVVPNNGIELENAPDIVTNGPYPVIGYNVDRNNVEDLTYGTNHDAAGIGQNILNRSNDELWASMKDLVEWGTFSDATLRQVGYDFINTFKNNTTTQTEISNPQLNSRVEVSPPFAAFLKEFGDLLRAELRRTNGDINSIAPIDLRRTRPIFGGLNNMRNGLTILLNDTEQSTVRLESYSRAGNHIDVVVEVTIKDHFGLDKHDAVSKDYIHHGFQSWWVLQHRRGFVPFRTKVVSRKTLKITL